MNGKKVARIQIDDSGRIVLPKFFRELFRIEAGDYLSISASENAIKIEPVADLGTLSRKGHMLVFSSGNQETITNEQVNALLEEDRGANAKHVTLKSKNK